ncbi:hypothetical protein [Pseudolactococcus piscium]|uniref:Uncharacterized protein n=1 Tax=Pseudolactococcus piscium MKFS47 TaxID=297352 RepID=A0A0D6DZE4_9LACT|nr:hypothetical protein [Lactococcus piscium]CEN29141.1 Uncharacterized protein LACPI_1941 [Lactococcus piscium MKFS47]
MRYDKPIYFVSNVGKHYDVELGEWVQGQTSRIKKFANITAMSENRQQVIFGDVSNKRLIVRLQRVYREPYDLLEIDGKSYQVDNKHVTSDSLSLMVVANG